MTFNISQVTFRLEEESDYRAVEVLNRLAFWNLYQPGCDEHYLVHTMRGHEDFIPQLALVADYEGQIIGNIMFTKARLLSESGQEKTVLTFGPLAVHPDYQRQGLGKALMAHAFDLAKKLGFDSLVIMGYPDHYLTSGFKSAKDYQVSLEGGLYPLALLVKELQDGALAGQSWTYFHSPLYEVDPEKAQAFDETFPAMTKTHQTSQDLFALYSQAILAD